MYKYSIIKLWVWMDSFPRFKAWVRILQTTNTLLKNFGNLFRKLRIIPAKSRVSVQLLIFRRLGQKI